MKKSLLDYTLKVRVPVTLFIVAASFALTYYVARPERDGIGYDPEQPIPFSHKLHAGEMGIDCQYCHTSVEDSRHASIPPLSTCMNCHTVAKKNSEHIKKLTKFYNEGKAMEWKRIHKIPDYAYFNHSVHVNKGIECQACHGQVERMDKLSQVESLTMGACLNCHRDAHSKSMMLKDSSARGPEHCNTCHR